jgi:hypothetical protein
MHTRTSERMPLAIFFLGCVAFFGAGVAIEQAHAQGTNTAPHAQGRNPMPSALSPLLDRAPAMPPPAFNPSSPYTVPQTRQTPVSPASPGSVFGSTPSTGVN